MMRTWFLRMGCVALLLTGFLRAEESAAEAVKAGGREEPRKRTVLVAHFENGTGQEQYDPAAAGMGDLIGVMLARQEQVTVVERQRLLALVAEQARTLEGLTGAEYALKAGKLLKADSVLVGRLFLVENKLTVSAQVLDIASARVLAAEQLACRPIYLAEAALQMAQRLSKSMSLPLPEIDIKEIDNSPIASLHFAQALSHYYAGNMDPAIMQFMRTVDLDPDYYEAHYWCGMAYSRLDEFEHAVIEWKAFLQREPESPRADELRKKLAEAQAKLEGTNVERLGPNEGEK